jgi:hypothetical protein
MTDLSAASCASTTASGGKLGLGCEGSSSLLHSPVTPFSIHFLDTSTLLYLRQDHKNGLEPLGPDIMVQQQWPAALLAYPYKSHKTGTPSVAPCWHIFSVMPFML